MIGVVAGMFTGATLGFLLASLLRGGHECDCQLPTLGQGTWLVCIDRHGEMSRCEPHICFADAFERLEQAMREEP